MKHNWRRFWLGVLLVFPLVGMTQIPFQREILYPGSLEVNSLLETPNGGCVMGGIEGTAPNRRGFMLRLDPCGELEWMKTYLLGQESEINHAILTIDGGYIMTGRTLDPLTGWDLAVIKTDGLGSLQWTRTFRGAGDETGFSVVDANLDGFVVSGLTKSYGAGASDILLIKLNLQGQIDWQRQFGGPQNESGVVVDIHPNDQIFVAGATNSFLAGGPYDGFLLNVSLANGQLNWYKQYDLGAEEAFRGMEFAPNGDVFLSGYTNFGNATTDFDFFLLRTNAQGSAIWAKTYDGGTDERGYQLALMPGGGTVVGGYAFGVAGGNWDLLALRTDGQGNFLWAKGFGGPQPNAQKLESMHYSIGPTLNGGIWMGSTLTPPNGIDRPYLVFTAPDGSTGGNCPDYTVPMTVSSVSFYSFQPAIEVKAFGYTTPASLSVSSQNPVFFDPCQDLSFQLGPDTTICASDSLLLQLDPIPGATFLWQDGSTGSSLTASAAQIYWVEITVDGCPRRDSLRLSHFPIPTFFPWTDSVICEGDSIPLQVPTGLSQWSWQDGSAGLQMIVRQSGLYTLTGFDGQCWTRDSVVVNVIPFPALKLGVDTSICLGDELWLDASLSNATYQWQDGSTTPFFQVSDSGLYVVERRLGICQDRDSIRVRLRISPQPDLGPDTTLCLGDSLLLTVSGAGTRYLWQDGTTLPSLWTQAGGLYWVEVFDGFCYGRDSLSLFSLYSEAVSLGPDTTICSGSPLILDPGFPGTQRIWQGNLFQASLQVDSTGWYWVRVVAPLCEDIDSIFVTVVQRPSISLPADTLNLCEGDSLFLGPATNDVGLRYRWDTGEQDSAIWLSGVGEKGVTVDNGFCQQRETIWIKPLPRPVFSVGPDTSFCTGDSILLLPQPIRGFVRWFGQPSSNEWWATEPGLYWAEQVRFGCSHRDSVILTEVPVPMPDLGPDLVICVDETHTLQLPVGGVYVWQDGQIGPTYEINQSGLYWVAASTSGCVGRDSLNVQQVATPAVSLGRDTVFCEGESISLFPEPMVDTGIQANWQDGTSLPHLDVSRPGWYWLELNNQICDPVRDSVFVAEISCDCPLFVPTAFSPNEDGINDWFGTWGDCQPARFDLQVFNRWGLVVFQAQEQGQYWDGRYQGVSVPEGVYTWVLRYTYRARGGNKEHFQRGTVSLIR